MTPSCRITIDGRLVSSTFASQIISCTVVDKEGLSSDTCTIVLNDWPMAAIPRTGAIIRIWMGYGAAGSAYMGAFAAEDVEVQMLPFQMTITGRSAELRGGIKTNRERHWDNTTVAGIVSQIAGENGLSPVISGDAGSHQYEWFAQQGESDVHFVERLAERHGAFFSVKDRKLIFASKATGMSAGGSAMAPVVVTRANLVFGTARVKFSDRTQYKEVKASWTDRKEAKKKDAKEQSMPQGEAIYRLGDQFADEAEAKRAAKSKALDLKRRTASFSCTIIGNPAARAGSPLSFAVGRPGVDGLPFIVGSATHEFSKSGYTTQLSGDSKNGKGG